MVTEFTASEAVVFPGMGPSRFADVGKFMVINPYARRLVAQADERLGYSLVDAFRDTEGDYSRHAQVSFLVNCVALAQWAEGELGARPEVVVGPSFGGKALAAYAGALSFSDAVWMTHEFARCLDEFFATEFADVVTHSFVRTPQDVLAGLFAEMDELGYWHDVSCHIDHDFHMVSLSRDNLEWFQQKLRRNGGMSLYTMHPPMHVSSFGPLRKKIQAEVFDQLAFSDPTLPVVNDQDGSVVTTGEQVRDMLLDGIVNTVRWPDAVATLKGLGVTKVHVAGQDSLFGRVAVTNKNFTVVAVDPKLAVSPRKRTAA